MTRLFSFNDHAGEIIEKIDFRDEAELQELIKDKPSLLARQYTYNNAFNKLYLISREKSILTADSTFYVDLLLVSEDAIPVIVEVKLCSNYEIYRKVVGQITEYASHAKLWKPSELRKEFQANNPGSKLPEDDSFWQRFSENLEAENFRLIIAADRIPDGLRRIIEFLDQQMNIEIYGVEINKYRSDNRYFLTTSIIENSLKDRQRPPYSVRQTATWTRESFLDRVDNTMGEEAAKAADSLIRCSEDLGLTVSFGSGSALANFIPKKDGKTVYQLGQIKTHFDVQLVYDWLKKLPGYKGETTEELKERILNIFPAGTDTQDMVKESSIWIPLEAFYKPELIESFRELIRYFSVE